LRQGVGNRNVTNKYFTQVKETEKDEGLRPKDFVGTLTKLWLYNVLI